MKTTLKVSAILSWINMIVWGLVAVFFILGALAMQNLSILIFAFLTGVAVLHSYAALKLHRSIRNPAIPLSSQTPVGIRFIGFVALFFGVLYIGYAITILQNIKEMMQLMQPQLPTDYKNIDISGYLRFTAGFLLLSGLSIAINVILNFRLLRWYFFSKV
jgi:hypothetical protein